LRFKAAGAKAAKAGATGEESRPAAKVCRSGQGVRAEKPAAARRLSGALRRGRGAVLPAAGGLG